MLENDLARLITRDILSSEEYNLSGLALYSNTPEDVFKKLLTGATKDHLQHFFGR